MIQSRLLRAVSCAALAAGLALPACRKEPREPAPPKGELPVEQTPVSSIYEEKPGVLYERPNRTPTSVPPTPFVPSATPSPRRTPS